MHLYYHLSMMLKFHRNRFIRILRNMYLILYYQKIW